MTVVYNPNLGGWPQGSQVAQPSSLEDRFEVIKEIGDGSFGSVALGRVRTAGAHIARRGTLVSVACSNRSSLHLTGSSTGRDQDDEKDLRILQPMSRTARGHLPEILARAPSPSPSDGYLPRSLLEETTHRDGIHGRQPVPADESTRSQAARWRKCKEHPIPDHLRSRTYPRPRIFPP